LDLRAVRDRVRARDPEFDDIGASLLARPGESLGAVEIRIPRHQVRDEGRAPLPTGRREGAGQAAHKVTPIASATVAMSLSPRPDRVTMIAASRSMSRGFCIPANTGAGRGVRPGRQPEASRFRT